MAHGNGGHSDCLFQWCTDCGLSVAFQFSKSRRRPAHDRVNRVRDEYVRRVDLDDHVKQLREGMKEMRDETREGLKETNKRLDQVLAVLAQDKKV